MSNEKTVKPVALSALEKHIKQMLLNYPQKFVSRWTVLSEMFLGAGDTGYSWNSKGQLVKALPPANYRNGENMFFADIDDGVKLAEGHLGNWSLGSKSGPSLFAQKKLVVLERERQLRKHREQYIDLYTRIHMDEPSYTVLGNIEPERFAEMPISRVPYEALPMIWAQVLLEVIDIAQKAMSDEFGESRTKEISKKAPKRWQDFYYQLKDVKSQLVNVKPKQREVVLSKEAKQEISQLYDSIMSDVSNKENKQMVITETVLL